MGGQWQGQLLQSRSRTRLGTAPFSPEQGNVPPRLDFAARFDEAPGPALIPPDLELWPEVALVVAGMDLSQASMACLIGAVAAHDCVSALTRPCGGLRRIAAGGIPGSVPAGYGVACAAVSLRFASQPDDTQQPRQANGLKWNPGLFNQSRQGPGALAGARAGGPKLLEAAGRSLAGAT